MVQEDIIITADVADQPAATKNVKSQVSRKLASLALAKYEQKGRFRVRQREQFRRALLTAGEALGWELLIVGEQSPVEKASEDLAKLTRKGTRSLIRDLTDEITAKRTEVPRLRATAKSMQKLAEDRSTEYPVEITYLRSAKDAVEGFVTKTETLVLNDAGEAEAAATKMENKIDSWARIREDMLEDLKQQRSQLEEMSGTLSEFVRASKPMLREVLAIVH